MSLAKIELDRADVKQIIDSIYNVMKLAEERSIDVNIKIESNDSVTFYVNKMLGMQIAHEISASEDIDIETTGDTTLVFSSKVFRNIINKTKSGRLVIEFGHERYEITTSASKSFSEPLSMSLYLFNNESPRDLQTHDNLYTLTQIDRDNFIEALDVMNTISNVVDIQKSGEELVFSVSDKVEGDGSITTETVEECGLNAFEGTYDLTALRNFVNSVNSDEIEILGSGLFDLQIRTAGKGLESRLDLAPKK